MAVHFRLSASPLQPHDRTVSCSLVQSPPAHSLRVPPPTHPVLLIPFTIMKLFHRKMDAWEVVEQKTVEPVATFTADERDSTSHLRQYPTESLASDTHVAVPVM